MGTCGLHDWKARIKAGLTSGNWPPEEDVLEELAQHARAMYESARADGESHEGATRRVDLQVALWADDATLLRRPRREPTSSPAPASTSNGSWLSGFWFDCRYALRLLRRRVASTALVVLTMAVGIGGTTTLFSVANGVLLAPLPWPDAERLALLRETRGGHKPRFGDVSNSTYLAWREQAATVEGMAAWTDRTVTMSGHGDAQRLQVAAASPELFALLGVKPLIGGLFQPGDASAARGRVLVLSEGLWRGRFAADPGVVGRIVHLDSEPHTVIGVLPDSQAYPDRLTRAWIPLRVAPAGPTSLNMFNAVVKLRAGVTPAQAASEGTARARATGQPIEMLMMALYGGAGPVEVSLTPLREARTATLRSAILVFFAAVGLLFITATANVASLFLARATSRTREMAIRAAIGAGGSRVMRQLLVESLTVSLIGGAAGLVFALLLHRAMPVLLGPDLFAARDIVIDRAALLFAATVSAAAGIAIGFVPALRARRLDLAAALGQDGGASVGTSRGSRTASMRTVIMAGQVAIACILMVGASLLARSFAALVNADRGYDPSGLIAAWAPLPAPGMSAQRRAEFASRVVERLLGVPGVTAAAFTDALPAARGSVVSFTMNDRTVQAESQTVSPGYFQAMGMTVLEGRPFTAEDALSRRPMFIVNRAFATRYLEGRATARQVRAGLFKGGPPTEIIGVVENVRHRPERGEAEPQVYLVVPDAPTALEWSGLTLLARTTGDPRGLAPTLRGIIREQDSSVPLDAVMTMEERLRTTMDGPRIGAVLIGAFAGIALLIAAVGLFGALSYVVAQRAREMAVRAALGARPADIMGLVLRQGLLIVGAGTAIGLPTALIVTQSIGTRLYGVSTRDPWTYALVPVLLLLVAAAACAIPARRATLVDPLRVLKGD